MARKGGLESEGIRDRESIHELAEIVEQTATEVLEKGKSIELKIPFGTSGWDLMSPSKKVQTMLKEQIDPLLRLTQSKELIAANRGHVWGNPHTRLVEAIEVIIDSDPRFSGRLVPESFTERKKREDIDELLSEAAWSGRIPERDYSFLKRIVIHPVDTPLVVSE